MQIINHRGPQFTIISDERPPTIRVDVYYSWYDTLAEIEAALDRGIRRFKRLEARGDTSKGIT